MKFQYRQLEDSSNYLVFDKDREYATFRLIDAPFLKPEPGCKNMELKVHEEVAWEINSSNIALLIAIFRFVFDSVLEITHELKGYRLCKMYSDDAVIGLAYRGFASHPSIKKSYDVKIYRGWVEIRKK